MEPKPHADPRQALAHRLHLALMHELDQGIDARRLLDDARYARDVLLVCQAYPGTELAALGEAFARLPRPLASPPGARAGKRPTSRARPEPDSAFDHVADSGDSSPSGLRRWLVPSNWFAR